MDATDEQLEAVLIEQLDFTSEKAAKIIAITHRYCPGIGIAGGVGLAGYAAREPGDGRYRAIASLLAFAVGAVIMTSACSRVTTRMKEIVTSLPGSASLTPAERANRQRLHDELEDLVRREESIETGPAETPADERLAA